jgi:hypothetical protein
MTVVHKHFPTILSENELTYFAHLEGVINSVDELCSMQVVKTKTSYNFRIAASLPKYNNLLIEEILKIHNIFKIKLDLSKSIKTSGTIVFKIILDKH